MPEYRFARATTDFLIDRLREILPDINASCAEQVKSSRPGSVPPQFYIAIGEVPNPEQPALAVKFISAPARRIADNQAMVSINMQILALIPRSGANTPENFEMARQISSDHVTTLFLTDSVMLVPKLLLEGPGEEETEALEVNWGYPDDIFGYKAADGKTVIQGWRMPWQCVVNVETR